jgi:hypothetical protein
LTGSPYRSAQLQTRHRLVFEVGDEGVRRLCESTFSPDESAAGAWAALYLCRAGMSAEDGGVALDLGEESAAALGLAEARDALRGACAAVEVIKQTLGVGARGSVRDAANEASSRE